MAQLLSKYPNPRGYMHRMQKFLGNHRSRPQLQVSCHTWSFKLKIMNVIYR